MKLSKLKLCKRCCKIFAEIGYLVINRILYKYGEIEVELVENEDCMMAEIRI